jgi:fucose permease
MADSTRASRPPAGLIAGCLYSFVVLGLPDGMLGVAWPAVRHGFGQPLAGLGELLIGSLCGYLAVSSTAGSTLRRFGTSTVLIGSAVTGCAGAGLIAATPWWAGVVAGALLLGAAGGGLDAALNTVVALAGRTRLMNLLHAAYGMGAALGPLAVTAALAAASSWRAAYTGLFALTAILAVAWIGLRGAFPPLPRHDGPGAGPSRPGRRRTLGGDRRLRAAVWLSLGVFFCYTGLEVAVSSWSASFLRGPGGLPATMAGFAVFAYWAGLTAGRVGAAALGSRLPAQYAVRAGLGGGIAGGAVVWANLTPAVTVAGLVLLGVSLGPIFPALINLTPGRLGETLAVRAIGWQIAAAGVGGTSLSALAGVLLQFTGLASFGPSLVGLAVVLAVLNLLVERAAPAGSAARAAAAVATPADGAT